MIAIAAMILASTTPPFEVRGSYEQMAAEHCRAEWPDDFRMQNYCMDMQIRGLAEFRQAYLQHGSVIERALESCVEEWTKYPRTRRALPDFRMIGHCARQQSDAILSQRP